MPEVKIERIMANEKYIWRVSYAGMAREFESAFDAAGFYHDLYVSYKKDDNLTQQ